MGSANGISIMKKEANIYVLTAEGKSGMNIIEITNP